MAKSIPNWFAYFVAWKEENRKGQDSRTTVKFAPFPLCSTAVPRRPKSCKLRVLPSARLANSVAWKVVPASAGVKVEPARAAPFSSTREESSREAVVLTRYIIRYVPDVGTVKT